MSPTGQISAIAINPKKLKEFAIAHVLNMIVFRDGINARNELFALLGTSGGLLNEDIDCDP